MKDLVYSSIKLHSEALNLIDEKKIYEASELIKQSLSENNTIFWCGNGGSASQANHLSAELIGGMYKDKKSPLNLYVLMLIQLLLQRGQMIILLIIFSQDN